MFFRNFFGLFFYPFFYFKKFISLFFKQSEFRILIFHDVADQNKFFDVILWLQKKWKFVDIKEFIEMIKMDKKPSFFKNKSKD